jgi:hypothetical protein
MLTDLSTFNDQNAHVDIIRQLLSNSHTGGSQRLGHFVEVPQGTSTTVNGITYTNNDEAVSEPFYIGPLKGYTVIELLSQPVFFFRTLDNMNYSITTARAANDAELALLDQNGDVDVENTRVRWTSITPASPSIHGSSLPELLNATPLKDIEFDDT